MSEINLLYVGKVLEVNLSARKTTIKPFNKDFKRGFIGGMGFTLKILYDEVGPQVDAFSPNNIS